MLPKKINSMIVVFEGIDGSGKTTICKEMLRYFNAKYICHPTEKYKILRDYLLKKIKLSPKAAFHTFLADILDNQDNITGNLVFIDRYVFSTIAYEIKDGYSYDEAKQIVTLSKPITPDMVVLIDAEPEKCIERIEYRAHRQKEKYDNLEYLKTVRRNFLKLYSERFLTTNWHILKNNGKLEEAIEETIAIIRR